MKHPVPHVLAAFASLAGPGFMVWAWINYVWPFGDLTARLVFVAFTAAFFWHCISWSIHQLRQAVELARRRREAAPPDR